MWANIWFIVGFNLSASIPSFTSKSNSSPISTCFGPSSCRRMTMDALAERHGELRQLHLHHLSVFQRGDGLDDAGAVEHVAAALSANARGFGGEDGRAFDVRVPVLDVSDVADRLPGGVEGGIDGDCAGNGAHFEVPIVWVRDRPHWVVMGCFLIRLAGKRGHLGERSAHSEGVGHVVGAVPLLVVDAVLAIDDGHTGVA